MSPSRFRILVGILVALAVIGGPSGCWAGASPEEEAGSEFASEFRVDGFRRTNEYVKAEDTIILLVGPPDVDLMTAATAPDWSPEPRPTDYPNTDRLYDRLIHSATMRGDYRCRVTIGRLRPGLEPPTQDGLTGDQVRAIKAGELAFLQVTIGCRHPVGA